MTASRKRLADDVRDVLARATCEGATLRLPPGQLDRKLYAAVAAAIEAMGGKWNRKAGAHLFDRDVAPLLAALLDDGLVPEKNPDAFFATPPELAARVASLALAGRGDDELRILEPSAGLGAIANELRALAPDALLHTVEIDPVRAAALRAAGHWTHEGDFLAFRDAPYDVIAMNPPFAITGDATAWITHVRHALTLLQYGGRLVAIVPAGIVHRTDAKHQAIRALFDSAMVEPLPPGAFKASGTGVSACLLVYDHPTDAERAA